MPQFYTVTSTRANTRVWNATLNGEPSGWEQPGFDDSAWPLSSTPGTPLSFGPPSGVEAVAPWSYAATDTDVMLYRSHFTHPGLQWQPYFFEYFGANAAESEIYLNGNVMLGIGKTAILSIYQPAQVDNVVAAAAATTINRWHYLVSGQYEAWLAWRLTFFIPPETSQVWSWGTPVSDKGVLGVGDTAAHLTPTLVSSLPQTVEKVVSNGKTTLFLMGNGDLYACGDNSTGLFGNNTTDTDPHPTPQFVAIGSAWPIKDIDIGDDCAMRLERDGTVYIWGPNAHGSHGTGDTTPHYLPVKAQAFTFPTGNTHIACGKNFSVIATRLGVLNIMSTGENTYGQLGQGTSGSDVLTWGAMSFSGVTAGSLAIQLAAGDDATFIGFSDGSGRGCGRALYGVLGSGAYAAGTGPNKIVTSPTTVPLGGVGDGVHGNSEEVRLAGPLSFDTVQLAFQTPPAFGSDIPRIGMLGDGTPYGGAGDNIGNVTYGTVDGPTSFAQGGTVRHSGAGGGLPVIPYRLAYISGGSQNQPYTPGTSRAVFGAILDLNTNVGIGFTQAARVSSGKLYTWGWGGAGQMGSGHDATTNIFPVWQNGLLGVLSATVAEGIMFAIAATGTPPSRGGRGYAQVIG